MRKIIGCVAAMICAMGIAGEVAAAEQNARPDPRGPLGLSPTTKLMFTMDAQYVPAQETPIVLAQAATPAAGTAPQPDYILQTCGETESTGDPTSAIRAVLPDYMLKNYIQNRDDHYVDLAAIKNITLLQGTMHGTLVAGTSTSGRTTYHYNPTTNYVGKDQATFMAEFEGKRYKIVVNLVVSLQVNENPLTDEQTPVCPPPMLIKVKN